MKCKAKFKHWAMCFHWILQGAKSSLLSCEICYFNQFPLFCMKQVLIWIRKIISYIVYIWFIWWLHGCVYVGRQLLGIRISCLYMVDIEIAQTLLHPETVSHYWLATHIHLTSGQWTAMCWKKREQPSGTVLSKWETLTWFVRRGGCLVRTNKLLGTTDDFSSTKS